MSKEQPAHAPRDVAVDVTVRLPRRPESVRLARRLVTTVLGDWDLSAEAEIVVLLTSEVVTNAVVHGGRDHHDAELAIHCVLRDEAVRVEVFDGNRLRPVVGDSRHDDETGRGMHLVDSLASEWGVTSDGSGKAVWFEVRRDA